MDLKNCIMYSMLGGMVVYGYMKYKDGSIERTIKNMKPMIETKIDELKK